MTSRHPQWLFWLILALILVGGFLLTGPDWNPRITRHHVLQQQIG